MPESVPLPPLLLGTLRTGVVPDAEAVAAATGKSADEVTRLLEAETEEAEPAEDPELARLRDKYRGLAAQACAAWLEENITLDLRVPNAVRADIESNYTTRLRREWGEYQRAQRGEDDDGFMGPLLRR